VRLTRDVPLAPLTTLGVGGRAAALAHAEHEDDVVAALALARDEGWPVLVLGGGSNVLVADEGFPGLVLRPAVRGVDEKVGAPTIWTVGAGEPWDALVARAVQRGLSGLECLSGIPGDVGGTPIQNVGGLWRRGERHARLGDADRARDG
jgi:UDP-N-acetylmuramate dehydrogenase